MPYAGRNAELARQRRRERYLRSKTNGEYETHLAAMRRRQQAMTPGERASANAYKLAWKKAKLESMSAEGLAAWKAKQSKATMASRAKLSKDERKARDHEAYEASKVRRTAEKREGLRQYHQTWASSRRDHLNDYHRNWSSKNKERHFHYASKRRLAKDNRADGTVSPQALLKRLDEVGRKCAYCHGPFEQWDHIYPLASGGFHAIWNLVPSCKSCNCSKGDTEPSRWLAQRKARGFRVSRAVLKLVYMALRTSQGELFAH